MYNLQEPNKKKLKAKITNKKQQTMNKNFIGTDVKGKTKRTLKKMEIEQQERWTGEKWRTASEDQTEKKYH